MSESTSLPQLTMPEFEPGWVWLCGTGPGDPGLMTLLSVYAIRNADVIIHDALIPNQILSWKASETKIVAAGKRGGRPSPSQGEVSKLLIQNAQAGKRVLRLKGGDPFMFGRGGEEADILAAAKVPFRIIPGISAGIGGLAYAGLPATHRKYNSSVTFLTGHGVDGEPPEYDWRALVNGAETLVFYMARRTISAIASALAAAGMPTSTPVAVIQNATTANQFVLESTLATVGDDIRNLTCPGPVIICFGEVVRARARLNWYSPQFADQYTGLAHE